MRFLRTHPRPPSHLVRLRYALLRSQFPALGVCCGVSRVILAVDRHFRSTPMNGHRQTAPACPVGATSGHSILARR